MNFLKPFLSVLFISMLFSCVYTYPTQVSKEKISFLLSDKRVDILSNLTLRIFDSFNENEKALSLAIDKDEKQMMLINSNKKSVNVFSLFDSKFIIKPIGNLTFSSDIPINIIYNPAYMEAYIGYENKIITVKVSDSKFLPTQDKIVNLINSKPEKILVSRDGNKIYSLDKVHKKIIVLDRNDNFKANYFSLSDNIIPSDFDIDDLNRIFIANQAGNNIIIINGITGEITKEIKLNTDNSIVSPNKIKIYFPPPEKRYDPIDEFVKKTKPVKKIYVICNNSTLLYLIDYPSLELNKTIELKRNIQEDQQFRLVDLDYLTNASKEDTIVVLNSLPSSFIPVDLISIAEDKLQLYFNSLNGSLYPSYHSIVTMKN